MKKLAIIGGGVTAGDYIDACHRIGYEPHYFSMADGKTANTDLAVFHEINIFDKDDIVDICKKEEISGVVPTTELTVEIAAYVADKICSPGLNPEVAAKITDKRRNRDCTKDLVLLKSPKYVRVSKIEDVIESGLSFPIILKPTNLGGKRGLTVVHTIEDFQSAFEYATSFYKAGTTPILIAEEFLAGGMECSVETVSIDGAHYVIQVTEKMTSGAPHCVELGHHQPARVAEDVRAKIENAVSEGLTAIGLNWGACHTEVKVINDEVYLIEFNARPGGDCIAHPLTKLSTGFDYLAAVARISTGDLKEIDTSCLLSNFSGLNYVVEQTAYLKPLYDTCQDKEWCYRKHVATDDLVTLTMNNLEHTNYFIYSTNDVAVRDQIAAKE